MAENDITAASSGVRWPKCVMWLSLTCSALGIAIAVVLDDPIVGQKGGAIGVALSFAILFAGRSTAEDVLSTNLATLGELQSRENFEQTDLGDELHDLRKRIFELEEKETQIRGALSSLLDWGDQEKRFLTVSSVISTLVTGFGDTISSWIIASIGC